MSDENAMLLAIQRVNTAIEAVRNGRMVIMTDDEDRENEGDLVFAAEDATPEKINFMVTHAKGLVCLTLASTEVERLKLPMMEDPGKQGAGLHTAFTVSIEAREGVSTGISALDRSHTIQTAINPESTAHDIVVPGHIFPLKARDGGVLERVGHTEGSVDLVRLAGKKPGGVICEIMNPDGTMARMSDLEAFAKKFAIPIVSIADLVSYRLSKDKLIEVVAQRPFKTENGVFEAYWFKSHIDHNLHFALVKGDLKPDEITDVRVQRGHSFVDVFGNNQHGHADSRHHINYALHMLNECKQGAVVYLSADPEESGSRVDCPSMDHRSYGIGAQILKDLGVGSMRLHVTSERSLKALSGFDLNAVEMQIIKEI